MADRGRKAFPISSPLIFEYDCDVRYKIHRNRVNSARAVINTAPPEDFLHFHYNAKKCMQQAERLYDVERANRILLEKMTKYAEYNGAKHLRPWACRNTVNYANGMVWRKGTGLHIDNMNIPVNNGTTNGSRKTDYQKKKELERQAKENMRMRDKITASKPNISAQALEHEYLENVSRIDRLSTFRGPRSASHRASTVKSNLDVAKSMRTSLHLAGSAGYQKDLARTVRSQRSQSARAADRYGASEYASSSQSSNSPTARRDSAKRPPRSKSAVSRNMPVPGNPAIQSGTGIHAYVQEAARTMKRAATFSRMQSQAGSRRASSARESPARSSFSGDVAGRVQPIRPASGRRSALKTAPGLTADASQSSLFGDMEQPGAAFDRSGTAKSLMASAPQASFEV